MLKNIVQVLIIQIIVSVLVLGLVIISMLNSIEMVLERIIYYLFWIDLCRWIVVMIWKMFIVSVQLVMIRSRLMVVSCGQKNVIRLVVMLIILISVSGQLNCLLLCMLNVVIRVNVLFISVQVFQNSISMVSVRVGESRVRMLNISVVMLCRVISFQCLFSLVYRGLFFMFVFRGCF